MAEDGDKPARNEVRVQHTRAQRRADLALLVRKLQEIIEHPGSEDHLAGVLVVAVRMVQVGPREWAPKAERAVVCYGREGLAYLVQAADETLMHVGASLEAGEHAREEARVRGRRKGKGGGVVH